MILDVAYIFVFFFEMLVSYLLFNGLGERRYSLISTLLIGTVLFEIGAAINIFGLSIAYINASYSILANFAFSALCFKIKLKRCAFYSVILIAISTFLEVTSVLIISSVSNRYVSDFENNPIQLVIEVTISKIIYFLIVMLILRFSKEGNQKVKIPVSFYLYPVISMISATSFWYISMSETVEYRNQIILAVISFLLFISTVFMFFAFQLNAQRENQLIMLQQEQDKIKTDSLYYDILEKQNNDLRIYVHDTKNHLSAIRNLNDNPEIEEYISKMLERLSEYNRICHSGNRLLDVIVDKYATECKINNIDFKFDIKNNNLASLEYYDTVTILGNLLDNAVEAVQKSNNKQITFETDYRNNFSVIIITNSCDDNPLIKSDILTTTKENKQLHGFGLKSVKKIIRKYNGDLEFEYDSQNKTFVVAVMVEN